MLGGPADCNIEFEDAYNHGAIGRVYHQSHHLQTECGLGAACSRHGEEEHLASYIYEI